MIKKAFILLTLGLSALGASADGTHTIRIATQQTDLILKTSPRGRLYQVYLGERLLHDSDIDALEWRCATGSDGSVSPRGHEVYAGSGGEDFFEPAVAITHADGNKSTFLYYQSHEQKSVNGGTETIIRLADNRYPVEVVLHYVAYDKENVIKAWSEICHHEKQPVTLWRYSSTMLYFDEDAYFLTLYHGDWAKEGQPATERLLPGKKIVDTKLGTRAAMYSEPFFELGLRAPASEQHGRAMLGTIGWTGNFRFCFEVDNAGALRVIPAINPFASDYRLQAGDVFRTPEFIFALSENGTAEASRNLHDWARRYQVKDGDKGRFTLLNNWENTGFDFDQEQLSQIMLEAKDLGVDMFLLDDGWFGNKYPRNDDHAGLGDWEHNAQKLPEGIAALTRAAREAGVKFGLWIEPEMVNPKSELFEQHPDWAITQPLRDTDTYRNQLVLDLNNPRVQDYVFGVVDRLLSENPEIAYFKWDCNSPITNIHSRHLGERQGNLYIDYVWGLYSVMRRVRAKYPSLPMMLCSGGGARCDYEALKYFTEFWPSDDTDPFERLYIQWSLSKFFPVKTLASHVTNWNPKTSIKFRVDVASMAKLGFDINLKSMSADDYAFCQQALTNYNAMRDVVLEGSQYLLLSPYEGNHMAVNYVDDSRSSALLFAYDLHPRYGETVRKVRLQGLDAARLYRIEETSLMPGAASELPFNGQTFSGDYLMKVGVGVLTAQEGHSCVLRLTATD